MYISTDNAATFHFVDVSRFSTGDGFVWIGFPERERAPTRRDERMNVGAQVNLGEVGVARRSPSPTTLCSWAPNSAADEVCM